MNSHPDRTAFFGSLWLILMAICAGCGSGGASESSIALSESFFASGKEAFDAGDWTKAEVDLTAAISAGALQPDQTEVALRCLALSRVRLGMLSEAEENLQQLFEGAAELDLYWAARAELETKKGDTSAANQAAAEARKINPKVILPSGVK